MKGLHANRRVVISACFDADQWELYDSPNRDEVADKLNSWLEMLVNSRNNTTRSEVEKAMIDYMVHFSEYGAADSEPIWFLSKVLDEIYIHEKIAA